MWGGCVNNCGEHTVSGVVDRHAATLRRATYCPDRTKGGVLVRPKYYRGDRGGTAIFPVLTDLTIRLEPSVFPSRYGWITPALRRLRLVAVTRARGTWTHGGWGRLPAGEAHLPSREGLQRWVDPRHDGWPERLLAACPLLESITIALGATEHGDAEDGADPDPAFHGSDGRRCVDWVVLTPPPLSSRAALRAFALAMRRRGPECQPSEGHVDVVPLVIVRSFLGRSGSWSSRTIAIPEAAQAVLCVTKEFCEAGLAGAVAPRATA